MLCHNFVDWVEEVADAKKIQAWKSGNFCSWLLTCSACDVYSDTFWHYLYVWHHIFSASPPKKKSGNGPKLCPQVQRSEYHATLLFYQHRCFSLWLHNPCSPGINLECRNLSALNFDCVSYWTCVLWFSPWGYAGARSGYDVTLVLQVLHTGPWQTYSVVWGQSFTLHFFSFFFLPYTFFSLCLSVSSPLSVCLSVPLSLFLSSPPPPHLSVFLILKRIMC